MSTNLHALPARSRCIAAVIAIAAFAVPPFARGDVYTWVDESGTTHVSNLTPPAGAGITQVVRAPAAAASVGPAASSRVPGADAAVREADLRALADRVRELERDNAAMASRATAAPPTPSGPPASSTVVVPIAMPVFVPYPAESATTTSTCDPLVFGCPIVTTIAPTVIVGAPRSRYVPQAGAQPVLWPAPNLDALGPWARNAQPFAPRHHTPAMPGLPPRDRDVRP